MGRTAHDHPRVSDRRIGLVLLLILLFLALGLGAFLAWQSAQSSLATPAISLPTATPVAGGGCHSVNGLPDPTCTPGIAPPAPSAPPPHKWGGAQFRGVQPLAQGFCPRLCRRRVARADLLSLLQKDRCPGAAGRSVLRFRCGHRRRFLRGDRDIWRDR